MKLRALILAVIMAISNPSVVAQSAVFLEDVVFLEERDSGIEGATISPDGEFVLAYGADSSIFLVDSDDPSNNSKLDWSGNSILFDSSFHPGGQTAMIVGSGGELLRFVKSNESVESAGGSLNFGDTDLRAVSWNGDGSWAYIGGEMGWLWRSRAIGDGGGQESFPLEGRGESDVNGISCIQGSRVCVISSSVDGIGVIDEEHQVHWIGGYGYPWIDVVCPNDGRSECVVVSTDLTIAIVNIDIGEPGKSTIFDNDIVQLQGVEGAINGIEYQSEGKSLISVAPFGIIEHDLGLRKSFPWLENIDVVDFNTEISDHRIVSSWQTGSNIGWVITSEGAMISFSPEFQEKKGGLLEIWIGLVIIGGTLLLISSLIVSSSPGLSRWVSMKIGSDEERERAIKESRRRSRKKRRA